METWVRAREAGADDPKVVGGGDRSEGAVDATAKTSGMDLGHEARIRLPNVDEAIDIGYAFHAANDPALAGTQSQRLAAHITEQFLALIARPENAAEVPYLACVQGIALSYGPGISRLKSEFTKRIERVKE